MTPVCRNKELLLSLILVGPVHFSAVLLDNKTDKMTDNLHSDTGGWPWLVAHEV